ncbi:MAG: NAD(P)/FAD-dependent oxidoreductase [Candidatus Micrarchaeia archaeon]
MVDYDVIVVGAGPGGSFAAKKAAKGGASVLLIDRRKELGAPVRCGEGLGSHWLDELGLKLSRNAISAEISGSVLYSPNMKRAVKIQNPETRGYVIDRKVFDKDLAIDAGRAGAEVIVKTEVYDVIKKEGKVCGVKANRMGEKFEATCKVLIAADGGESTVARRAGLNSTATLYDTDFGIEYEMVNVECEDLIEIYFGWSIAPRGYVWVFPKGKDVANVGVGIGGLEKGNAIDYLEKFIKNNKRFKDAQTVAIKGGLIPVGEPLKELVADGLMVVGTAAHQVDPIHGGGMALAMEAGGIAGEVAAKCALEGKTDKKSLYEYETKWRKKAEPKLMRRLRLRKVLEKLNDDDLNAVFENLNDEDLDKLIKGDYKPVVEKVLLKRPQLLKVLSALF